jgi:Flp pilus assembly protein CpaB
MTVKASTFFALTVAVLIGLGVAVAAKTFGLFSPPPRPPEPPVAKKTEVQVLAAASNLFKGDMLDPGTSVKPRALRPEEVAHYNEHKDDYLPPNPQMVYLRVADANIETDQVVLRSQLQELAKPELLHTRLVKNMRAINLAVPKERSAGGLIAVGEWVDVLVTSTIEAAGGATITRTACVAPCVRVVAKRNSLWPIYAALPDGKPVNFTLEVNPYRAALLDYVGTHGNAMLMPLPASDQKRLEEMRQRVILMDEDGLQFGRLVGLNDDNEAETARVTSFARGEMAVGEADMVRVFGLSTTPPPAANVTVERMTGIRNLEPAYFTPNGNRSLPPSETETPRTKTAPAYAPNYRFTAPADCPTCSQTGKTKSVQPNPNNR